MDHDEHNKNGSMYLVNKAESNPQPQEVAKVINKGKHARSMKSHLVINNQPHSYD